MKTGKALLAVAAGIAAGVVIGVLFAPDKGIDTRKKITKKGKDLANEVEDKIEKKFDNLMKSISGKFVHVKNDKESRKPELAEM